MNSLESPAMGPDTEKGDILSTWKEIAAYLNSGVRTCLRWEKENGLPVHRQEGAPRSRIFAYTGELDAWFKSRLGNGTIKLETASSREVSPGRYWISFLTIIVIAIALMVIFRGKESPSVTPGPGKVVPQSTGPYTGSPGMIIESEFSLLGLLRVWERKTATEFFEHWRMSPVRHASFALGDLDGDDESEVAAPAYCRDFEGAVDGLTPTRIRFFINFYKNGHEAWWKTTYFDKSQAVYEKDNFEFSDVAIADLDGVQGNEIVMLTAHSLSVFGLAPKTDDFRLLSTQSSFIEGTNTLMRSLAVGDVDCDGQNEILATANEGEEGAEAAGKGWLLAFRWKSGHTELIRTIPLPGHTSPHALEVGDVIQGGQSEVVMACYRDERGQNNAYIIGWTFGQGIIFEKFIDEVGQGLHGGIFVAVGDLSPRSGDEILIARNLPNRLISYAWDGSNLVQGPSCALDERTRVETIQIGRPRRKNAHSCILVGGSAEIEGKTGRSYLELINFSDGYSTEWTLLGGEKDAQPVSFASFIDRKAP